MSTYIVFSLSFSICLPVSLSVSSLSSSSGIRLFIYPSFNLPSSRCPSVRQLLCLFFLLSYFFLAFCLPLPTSLSVTVSLSPISLSLSSSIYSFICLSVSFFLCIELSLSRRRYAYIHVNVFGGSFRR